MKFTVQDMDRVVDEFSEKTISLLRSKAADYANDEDRLKNFREVASAANTTPEKVCFIYMMKHVQAIGNMVDRDDFVWEWTKPDGSEGAKQRIADAINYLFLLAANVEHSQRKMNTRDPVTDGIVDLQVLLQKHFKRSLIPGDAAIRILKEVAEANKMSGSVEGHE